MVTGIVFGTLSWPLFFYSYSEVGVVFTMVIVNCLTFIIIAFLKWIKKEEEMSLLKAIYLSLMIITTIIVAFSKSNVEIEQPGLSFSGIIILLLTTLTMILSITYFGLDSSQKQPLLKNYHSILEELESKNYKTLSMFLRAIYKNLFIYLFASIFLIILSFILWAIVPMDNLGIMARQFITEDIKNIVDYLTNFQYILFSLTCASVPSIFLAVAASTWPKSALRYDMWASVFKLVQPVQGLYIGYFIWNEKIRVDYIVFCTILLLVTLFIRYFQESNQLRRVVFIFKVKWGTIEQSEKYLLQFKEIDKIQVLWGTYNLIVHVTIRSIQTYGALINIFEEHPTLILKFHSISMPLEIDEVRGKRSKNILKEVKKMKKSLTRF